MTRLVRRRAAAAPQGVPEGVFALDVEDPVGVEEVEAGVFDEEVDGGDGLVPHQEEGGGGAGVVGWPGVLVGAQLDEVLPGDVVGAEEEFGVLG